LNTKWQLQTETDDGIRKLLRKYEKKIVKELNFSSESSEEQSVDSENT
jgi:hypothetical protein